jgi:hypothetical protein
MRNVKVKNAIQAKRYEARLAALRAAIDEGDASGVAKGNF